MKRISFPELKDRIIKAAVLAPTAAAVMALVRRQTHKPEFVTWPLFLACAPTRCMATVL